MKTLISECVDERCERQSRQETSAKAREVTDCCRTARCNLYDLVDFAGAGILTLSLSAVSIAAAVASVVPFVR